MKPIKMKTLTKEVTEMVANMKEEVLAAGIRQQIQSLRVLSEEIETERLTTDALAWRIRAIELQLRRIREAA
jgi:hypothetical protein